MLDAQVIMETECYFLSPQDYVIVMPPIDTLKHNRPNKAIAESQITSDVLLNNSVGYHVSHIKTNKHKFCNNGSVPSRQDHEKVTRVLLSVIEINYAYDHEIFARSEPLDGFCNRHSTKR